MRRGPASGRRRLQADDRAVSEVLGVVMLLAMVITIMGGVWVFLNPYLTDFEDNTNWNSATGIADRIEDRIEVAGNAPDGTGFRNTLAIQSTSIRSVQNVESWTIAADLTPHDAVVIHHMNDSALTVYSANESARSVTVERPEGVFTANFTASHEPVLVNHDGVSSHWMVVTVYDEVGTALHRSVDLSLSGLQITTSLGQGEHEIVLMNNARAERFPNGAWDVSVMPALRFDRLANDEVRLSVLLTDVRSEGAVGSGSNIGIEFVSGGPMALFTGEAHNVRFNVHNHLHAVVTPQYHETWLTDYTIQRSAGTLDSYIGFAPYERASGADGFTVQSQGLPLYFEVDFQRLEVSP